VNPHETEVLGEKCYPDVDSVPEPIDIVDIFRRSEFVPEIVEAAIRKGAKVSGCRRSSPRRGRAPGQRGGLEVVMDRCILKEPPKAAAGAVRFATRREFTYLEGMAVQLKPETERLVQEKVERDPGCN